MSAMRVIVCDDEPLAVRRLEIMLGGLPDVTVVASASGGRQAIDLVREHGPDLLLLDVEMPEVDGFDVVDALAKLQQPKAPLIAFITAFRRFAPQAFDSGAIDFLPKPVRIARLETTLARARDALRSRQSEQRLVELEAMLAELRAERRPERDHHVWVARRGEVVRVDLDRLDRVEAEGAYVRLHLGETSYLHREPIGEIERRLDGARFVRVHRSHIVRPDRVSSIRRTVHGGSELILVDSVRIPLGRKYAGEARRRLLAEGCDVAKVARVAEACSDGLRSDG